jgi:transposase-like protein
VPGGVSSAARHLGAVSCVTIWPWTTWWPSWGPPSRERRQDLTVEEGKAELARLRREVEQQREASVQVPAEPPPARFPRVELRVPEGDQLDHEPTAGEVKSALTQAFGPVEVLEVRPQPTYKAARHRTLRLDGSLDDFHAALESLERDTCAIETDHCIPGRLNGADGTPGAPNASLGRLPDEPRERGDQGPPLPDRGPPPRDRGRTGRDPCDLLR